MVTFIQSYAPQIIIIISLMMLCSGIAGCIAYKRGYSDGVSSERSRLAKHREKVRKAYHECSYR